MKPSVWSLQSNYKVTKNQYLNHYAQDVSLVTNDLKKKDTDHLRVCTYNVHGWTNYIGKPNLEKQIKIIKEIDADIIILEEYENDPNISKYLDTYKYTANIDSQKYLYNVIYSKYPITKIEIKNLEFYRVARHAVKITITFKGVEIDIIGTHLDVFDSTEKTRIKQVQQILNMITNKNTIIAGDFNAIKENDYTKNEMEWIAKNTLGECHVEATDLLQTVLCDTFGSLKYSVWTGRRVDYIWITKDCNIKVMNNQVYYSIESDHFPILTDLILV